MIPYFRPGPLHVGPLTLHPWGAMVAAGFLLGSALAQRIARRRGLDPVVFWNILPWLVVGACVFGHLGDVAYRPQLYLEQPLRIFAVWDGLASYSGFFGCAVIAVLYFRAAGVDPLKGCDVLVIGVTFGWAIGRVGCFLVHDHIGRTVGEVPAAVRAAIGWLAVEFPPGTASRGAPAAARFDLGLLDSLLAWALLAVLLVLERSPRRPGMLVAVGAILYGGARFLLDFLRNVDLSGAEPRILGLTPGQYASIVAVAIGAAVLRGRESFSSGQAAR